MADRKATTHDLRKRAEGPADKYAVAFSGNSRGGLSWADAGADDVLAAIHAATEDGSAVLFGKTQDGGALVLQVWNASGRHKLYPASMAELNEALSLIEEVAKA